MQAAAVQTDHKIQALELSVDPAKFYLEILIELNETLNDVVGEQESHGLISLVADKIGRYFEGMYRHALGMQKFDVDTLAAILIDLKRRIGGEFYIHDIKPTRIELKNTRCPFSERVVGQTTLCAMTSNVFGRISADSQGYAAVELSKTIARGDGHCHVIVHLDSHQERSDDVIEYFDVSEL
ncbi:methanogen output domain 1-containing protein [Bowmanella sp. JS7-9]|uniref:Methanogen output domain 1-containing protein n=1 Tax=Pseudobowmanella zhangzhouensis TaxID=1537679 RepID=A0ABW1XF51_9ALTE|nr:methanogen output domain 1-containing protein [Bowmanella sp. JS7-9]TBX21208.1 hypothetical protein TK45_11530 [Bowmanella sp. JS7-9]